jgi:hypothetical protein
MMAVQAKNFKAMQLLLEHGALIGQINKKGKNALTIALDTLDETVHETGLAKPSDVEILASLAASLKRQHNFLELHQEAINRAEHLLTREIILVDWAWDFLSKGFPNDAIVEKHLREAALLDFIRFAIQAPPGDLSQKTIDRKLGDAGISPPLIEAMRPYIAALPQIKFQLFGSTQGDIAKLTRIYLSGIAATLEQIRLKAGDHWAPFQIDDSSDPVFKMLNQIASIELNWLIKEGLKAESLILTPVFETLFDTCFNQSFTKPTLPATFPKYPAAAGTVATALMKRGVYAAFATMIETAWQKAWTTFAGTPMSTDSNSSSSASSSISSNSSSSSSSSTSVATVIDTNEMDDFFSSEALASEWIDELSVLSNPLTFLESAQGQALLQAFRDQLVLAVKETGNTILDLPKATPEDARIYAELMHRQLYMLMQFIQAE